MQAVISTASSTLSRQQGDSIETVDHYGQLALVEAARGAGVARFVFVSFRENPDVQFPLTIAKRAVETALESSGMAYTILQVSYFMEVWLTPALGFDVANRHVRIYGDGDQLVSWISYRDVARVAAAWLLIDFTFSGSALGSAAAARDTAAERSARPADRSAASCLHMASR